ncbi:MAG: tRNA 4-thiouridine(8) synthase ThiI [Ruminococcaceae bacterium]|nr:tRNA 4-thiouridine(8) synthase ThiI [Oscillospiraceae bacterium]
MQETLLLKCGELVLKGLNRAKFEDRLISALRHRLRDCGGCAITSSQSTITVRPDDENFDMDSAVEICKKVFGLVSLCRAAVCEKNMDEICAIAPEYLADTLRAARTFKVEAKRSDKRFPLKSPEIMREVGGCLLSHFPHLKVDVHNPEITVRVEIRDKDAYIHTDPLPGAGGLPVGINGRAGLLISGGIDSPVAAYMMARRGLTLHAIHFFSYPYTSQRALDKVKKLLSIVARWSGPIQFTVVPFTHLQEEIRDHCPEYLSTLILRRFMVRAAEAVARDNGCAALVTGESLGQVASQTLLALGCTDAVCNMPIFRPLIGMDKSDIVKIARQIDTFETSILPYEDCCTVFTPRHPETKPKLAQVEAGEAMIDGEALLAEALSQVYTERIVADQV